MYFVKRLPSGVALALSCFLTFQQTASLIAQEAAQPSSATPSTPPPPHTLLDGTPVKLRLSQTITSADAKVGQEIPFEVVEEVQIDGYAVLPKGANAIATVTEADHKKSMGRAGKLNIAISYGRLADNEKVALRAVKDSKGRGHVGAMTGAIVATSIVFFPAAPLFLFIHGKDVTIPQGTEITAFVEGDMHLDMSRFGASTTIGGATSVANAGVAIESNPAGADIEVDGGFVGNTPSTVNLTPGSHEIAVKKKGFTGWTRKVNVTGGNIRLSAQLEPETTSGGSSDQPSTNSQPEQPATSTPQVKVFPVPNSQMLE